MVRRRIPSVVAVGAALLGLGAWGTVSAVSAHAGEAATYCYNDPSFFTISPLDADFVSLDVSWCGEHNGRSYVDAWVSKRQCLNPPIPTCEIDIVPDRVWNGEPAVSVQVTWPAGQQNELHTLWVMLAADGTFERLPWTGPFPD